MDHPGDARPGFPHHRRRHRAHQPATRRSDPAHPQRNRRAVQPADHRPGERRPALAAMVHLATTPAAPRQNLPLPAASPPTMNVTKSGWSTKSQPTGRQADPRYPRLPDGTGAPVGLATRVPASDSCQLQVRAGSVKAVFACTFTGQLHGCGCPAITEGLDRF